MVKIVTDSTSDITSQIAQELGITVVPYFVHFGTEAYRDRIDLSSEEFYAKLKSAKTLPTTAAPPPGAFAEAFDKLAEETDEVLAIIISSNLSAGYDSALKGEEQRKKKDFRVEIINTPFATIQLGILVVAAAKEAQTGASLEQVIDIVRGTIPKIHLRIAFDTLEYLRRGGRVGRSRALMGGLLNIKPITTIRDGHVEPIGRERSRAKAIEHLFNFAKGFTNIKELMIGHAACLDDAMMLAQRLNPIFPKERMYICPIGPVVGTHLGPGALNIAILEE